MGGEVGDGVGGAGEVADAAGVAGEFAGPVGRAVLPEGLVELAGPLDLGGMLDLVRAPDRVDRRRDCCGDRLYAPQLPRPPRLRHAPPRREPRTVEVNYAAKDSRVVLASCLTNLIPPSRMPQSESQRVRTALIFWGNFMKKNGLWYSVGGPPLSDHIESQIYTDDYFTTTAISSRVHPKKSEVVIVSLDGSHADYIAIAQRGRKVATGQVTVLFSNFCPLQSLGIQEIRDRIPPKIHRNSHPPEIGFWRPTPRLWQEILQAIAACRPEVTEVLWSLNDILAASATTGAPTLEGVIAVERDAVASAVDFWGGSRVRKRVLRNAAPRSTRPTETFLSHLREIVVREDLQIAHDQINFPGMVIDQKDIVSSVVLRDPLLEDELTIINCNRQPLEATLGVDLIYYSHAYDSFVMVQYKRMTRSPSNERPCYRPSSDSSHAKEILRMLQATKAIRAASQEKDRSIQAYRLSSAPFYIKLCEDRCSASLDAQMVPGMYIPLRLWQRLLRTPETKGSRGGIVINWDTCKRRFNNEEFSKLLRRGWIGSAANQTQYLKEIIESVLSSGRMLVLAATSRSSRSMHYSRDAYGRFVADRNWDDEDEDSNG